MSCFFGHKWSKWSQVEHGRQTKTCLRCGYIQPHIVSTIEYKRYQYAKHSVKQPPVYDSIHDT
jgi:hypothetical protein